MVEFEARDKMTFRTTEFQEFALNTALQIAAHAPAAVSADDLADVIPIRGRTSASELASGEALLDQAYVKDPTVQYKDVLHGVEAKLGIEIRIRRFVRYGEPAA